jgi:hypothetical protein
MKGSQIIVNQIAMVRTSANGTAASVSTYAGIFSPTRASYDLTVRADALLSALAANNFDPSFGGQAVNYATEQGDPSHLRGLAVSVFGLQAIRAEAVIAYTPSLRVTWSVIGANLEGRATNDGPGPMEDVAVISRSGGVMVGSLAPGESKTFRMPLRNLNGSSASQQVYGIAAFDSSTAAQRKISVRSQVIDALVGYSGGFPGRMGGVAGGIDRGPFVIGWQADKSPVEIEIDGERVQRYAQAVEIISGGATLGPGPVTLSPSELSTEVLATDGQASQNQPGSVMLANGEVTFRMGLPLEATGLQPTNVTLIVASDAGTIFYDQENVGAFLPKGFRLAVYDTIAAEWFDVGDLSQRSRFDIDDPARVLDASGRLLLKITGTGVPTETGQMSVFAGARVSGVVAQ